MAAQIVSITGLQRLVNLQYLNIDWNAFQSVNISNLPNLTFVDISDCDVPGTSDSSLTSVNFTGSTNIEELRLDDSNLSGGINVSSLVNLIWLDLDQCNLPSLNLSGLTNLFYVDAWGNEDMTSINITGCSTLVDLALDSCNLTQQAVDHVLAELDLQGNTGGYVWVNGDGNAIPSAAGLVSIANLQAKGWSVYYNAPPTTTTTTVEPTTTTTTEVPTTTTTTI